MRLSAVTTVVSTASLDVEFNSSFLDAMRALTNSERFAFSTRVIVKTSAGGAQVSDSKSASTTVGWNCALFSVHR